MADNQPPEEELVLAAYAGVEEGTRLAELLGMPLPELLGEVRMNPWTTPLGAGDVARTAPARVAVSSIPAPTGSLKAEADLLSGNPHAKELSSYRRTVQTRALESINHHFYILAILAELDADEISEDRKARLSEELSDAVVRSLGSALVTASLSHAHANNLLRKALGLGERDKRAPFTSPTSLNDEVDERDLVALRERRKVMVSEQQAAALTKVVSQAAQKGSKARRKAPNVMGRGERDRSQRGRDNRHPEKGAPSGDGSSGGSKSK